MTSPPAIFLDFLDGMVADLPKRRLTHFEELRQYCYQVASTVGLAMSHVLGATSRQALAAAENLGIAMQLTNILRDVGGDLARDRIYLPNTELERFGLSHAHLTTLAARGGLPDERFRRLLQFQIARAHSYYRSGMSGIWLLSPDCRLPILLASRLYRKILRVIERNGYDVLRRRAVTSPMEKLTEMGIALILNRLWRSGEHQQRSYNTFKEAGG